MESTYVHLFKASDGEDSYAIRLDGQVGATWRAQRVFGSTFQKVWSVELQGGHLPEPLEVDWDAVLERVIEAYDLNDPVITGFQWPLQKPGC